MSKQFLGLTAVAFILGGNLAYYLGTLWLENFSHHINMLWQSYAITSVGLMFIVIITVGYQSVITAQSNPFSQIGIKKGLYPIFEQGPLYEVT